jgi:hypothetical protein
MSLETWDRLTRIIQGVKPAVRVEMAMCGEPTLHEDLPTLLWMGRKTCPEAQFQITTNGTMLTSGKWTYQQLFEAGVNIMYVDMYAPREQHIEMAEASGYMWYEYLDPPPNAIPAWSYHGPDLKMIVLMENPSNWPKTRANMGRLGTWLNHLDWEAAAPFGLTPVTEPVENACFQLVRHVAVSSHGDYLLCCQDFMHETAGQFGSVREGMAGFYKFWFGEKMQRSRIALYDKRRRDVPECSRCSVTFSTRPGKRWPDEVLSRYWDGERWVALGDE